MCTGFKEQYTKATIARLGKHGACVVVMRTTTRKKRKDSSLWNRRTNTVPLSERGAFQIDEAADYLSRSITSVRRLIKRGQLTRLPGFRDVVIAKVECDRFLREQTDLAKLVA
jgi:hypothetical protein